MQISYPSTNVLLTPAKVTALIMRNRVAAPFHVNVDLLPRQLQLVHMTKLLPVFTKCILRLLCLHSCQLNFDIL